MESRAQMRQSDRAERKIPAAVRRDCHSVPANSTILRINERDKISFNQHTEIHEANDAARISQAHIGQWADFLSPMSIQEILVQSHVRLKVSERTESGCSQKKHTKRCSESTIHSAQTAFCASKLQ